VLENASRDVVLYRTPDGTPITPVLVSNVAQILQSMVESQSGPRTTALKSIDIQRVFDDGMIMKKVREYTLDTPDPPRGLSLSERRGLEDTIVQRFGDSASVQPHVTAPPPVAGAAAATVAAAIAAAVAAAPLSPPPPPPPPRHPPPPPPPTSSPSSVQPDNTGPSPFASFTDAAAASIASTSRSILGRIVKAFHGTGPEPIITVYNELDKIPKDTPLNWPAVQDQVYADNTGAIQTQVVDRHPITAKDAIRMIEGITVLGLSNPESIGGILTTMNLEGVFEDPDTMQMARKFAADGRLSPEELKELAESALPGLPSLATIWNALRHPKSIPRDLLGAAVASKHKGDLIYTRDAYKPPAAKSIIKGVLELNSWYSVDKGIVDAQNECLNQLKDPVLCDKLAQKARDAESAFTLAQPPEQNIPNPFAARSYDGFKALWDASRQNIKDELQQNLAASYYGEFLPAYKAWVDTPAADQYRADHGGLAKESFGYISRGQPDKWYDAVAEYQVQQLEETGEHIPQMFESRRSERVVAIEIQTKEFEASLPGKIAEAYPTLNEADRGLILKEQMRLMTDLKEETFLGNVVHRTCTNLVWKEVLVPQERKSQMDVYHMAIVCNWITRKIVDDIRASPTYPDYLKERQRVRDALAASTEGRRVYQDFVESGVFGVSLASLTGASVLAFFSGPAAYVGAAGATAAGALSMFYSMFSTWTELLVGPPLEIMSVPFLLDAIQGSKNVELQSVVSDWDLESISRKLQRAREEMPVKLRWRHELEHSDNSVVYFKAMWTGVMDVLVSNLANTIHLVSTNIGSAMTFLGFISRSEITYIQGLLAFGAGFRKYKGDWWDFADQMRAFGAGFFHGFSSSLHMGALALNSFLFYKILAFLLRKQVDRGKAVTVDFRGRSVAIPRPGIPYLIDFCDWIKSRSFLLNPVGLLSCVARAFMQLPSDASVKERLQNIGQGTSMFGMVKTAAGLGVVALRPHNVKRGARVAATTFLTAGSFLKQMFFGLKAIMVRIYLIATYCSRSRLTFRDNITDITRTLAISDTGRDGPPSFLNQCPVKLLRYAMEPTNAFNQVVITAVSQYMKRCEVYPLQPFGDVKGTPENRQFWTIARKKYFLEQLRLLHCPSADRNIYLQIWIDMCWTYRYHYRPCSARDRFERFSREHEAILELFLGIEIPKLNQAPKDYQNEFYLADQDTNNPLTLTVKKLQYEMALASEYIDCRQGMCILCDDAEIMDREIYDGKTHKRAALPVEIALYQPSEHSYVRRRLLNDLRDAQRYQGIDFGGFIAEAERTYKADVTFSAKLRAFSLRVEIDTLYFYYMRTLTAVSKLWKPPSEATKKLVAGLRDEADRSRVLFLEKVGNELFPVKRTQKKQQAINTYVDVESTMIDALFMYRAILDIDPMSNYREEEEAAK